MIRRNDDVGKSQT